MSDFYNKSETVDFFARMEPSQRLTDELKKIANPISKKALDHGCGGGRHTELLLQMGFDTFACDKSQAMLDATRNRVRKYLNNNEVQERIIYADMENLPFEDNFFDVIVSRSVISETGSLESYELAIKELGRVLKLGGELLLAVMTNKSVDPSFVKIKREDYSYISPRGPSLTLLPVSMILRIAENDGLTLKGNYEEEVRNASAIPRAILRCTLIKSRS